MEKHLTKSQMEKQLNSIQAELVKRISKLHKEKFGGNNSHLANKAGCSEGTIRRILLNNQNITTVMLCRIAYALDLTPSELLNGFQVKD